MVFSKFLSAGKFVFLFILVLTLIGCSQAPTLTYVPLPTKATRELKETSLNPSGEATAGISEEIETEDVVATETPVPSPTSTQKHEVRHTQVASQTPAPTNTLEPATLSLNQDTACFTGASFEHGVVAYIHEGTDYQVQGRIVDDSWWIVGIEDEPCWVYGEFVSVRGAVDTIPVAVSPPLPSLTPTEKPSTTGIYYILISENTGGPFGCGDSLIRYYPGVWVNGDMDADVTAALNALFSNHNQYVNGLYNPMYKSRLKAKGVEVVGNDVRVYLAGDLVRPKDACESKRMHDQVWYTVAQFSPSRAVIYLGNALLGDLLVVAK